MIKKTFDEIKNDLIKIVYATGGVLHEPTDEELLSFEINGITGVFILEEKNEVKRSLLARKLVDCYVGALPLSALSGKTASTRDNFAIKTLRDRLEAMYGSKCAVCGSVDNITLEHFYPIKMDNITDFHNCFLLCYPCNNSVGSLHAQAKMLLLMERGIASTGFAKFIKLKIKRRKNLPYFPPKKLWKKLLGSF